MLPRSSVRLQPQHKLPTLEWLQQQIDGTGVLLSGYD